MSKILITGSDGFIGKSLAEFLAPDHELILIGRKYDLTKIEVVDNIFENNPNLDFVIHAAVSGGRRTDIDSPKVYYDNTMMIENISSKKHLIPHIIGFSSGAIDNYINGTKISHYASSKYIEVKKLENFDKFSIVKIWGCFGKYENDSGFVKANMIRYKNHEPMLIDSNIKMDYIYIKNIYSHIDLIINGNTLKNVFNELIYDNAYWLHDICAFINNLDKHKVPIIIQHQEKKSENYFKEWRTSYNVLKYDIHNDLRDMYGQI